MAKILVVEDSTLMKVYLKRCLETHGYEVEDWTPMSAMEIPDKIMSTAHGPENQSQDPGDLRDCPPG